MPLHIHRSNRAERLVEVLVRQLGRNAPDDPFDEVPIVVGARGMERWLRNQVASHRGVAAQLAFPFPRPALDGAVTALLGEHDEPRRFWSRNDSVDPWRPEKLAWRVLNALRERAHSSDPATRRAFAHPRQYVSTPGSSAAAPSAVNPREAAFALEVAQVVDGLLRQRPDQVREWIRQTGAAKDAAPDPSPRWLQLLVQDLLTAGPGHASSERRSKLQAKIAAGGQLATIPTTLHVFGLSTLPREELRTLSWISCPDGLNVHLYQLAPSAVWAQDQMSKRELATALRRAESQRQVLGPDATMAHQREAIDRRHAANALLADFGRPSRDVQALLEAWADHYHEADPGDDDLGLFVDPIAASDNEATALRALQRGILLATPTPEPGDRSVLEPSDASVRLLACHGALRQVEELREQLWAALREDPTLQPRDILVMTPDIATYAPLVMAVFSEPGEGAARPGKHGKSVTKLPAIPTHIADLGLRAINPIADVLLAVLELAVGRLTWPALLALMEARPVRRRFGLGDSDLQAATRMLADAGLRWGQDAADRKAAGQPALRQNTVDFALERLALGALFLDEPADGARSNGAAELRRPHYSAATPLGEDATAVFAPFDAMSLGDLPLLGRVMACVNAVGHHRAEVSTSTSAEGWHRRLQAIITELCATTDAATWLVTTVMQELEELRASMTAAGTAMTFTPRAALQLLQGRFDMRSRGDRHITGAVTVCAMEPMRSVPFRVIALLGMDDGSFPRTARKRAWDPLAHRRRVGEHDPRDIDRHLLLEALLSTRDRLLILWNGFDAHTAEPQPPAVPVAELLDVLDAHFVSADDAGEPVSARKAVQMTATLLPWSAGRRPHFDAAAARAANVLHDAQHGLGRAGPHIHAGKLVMPKTTNAGDAFELSCPALAKALLNGPKTLLHGGFGLRMDDNEAAVEERSPVEMSALDKWQVREAAVSASLDGYGGDLATELSQRWRAEGKLGLGPAGEDEIAAVVAEAEELVAAADVLAASRGFELVGRQRPCRAWATVPVGGHFATLRCESGWIAPSNADATSQALVFVYAGAAKPKRLLPAWLTLLTLRVADVETHTRGAWVVTRESGGETEGLWLAAPAKDAATRMLVEAVTLWREARATQVPLFPETSYALVAAMCAHSAKWHELDELQRRDVRDAITAAWTDDDSFDADGADRWIRSLIGTPNFDATLPEPDEQTEDAEPAWLRTARAVWQPLVDAQGDDGEVAA